LPWNLIFFWTQVCRQSHSWKAMSSSPVLAGGSGDSFPRTPLLGSLKLRAFPSPIQGDWSVQGALVGGIWA
jgi:hypothetical protein